MDIIIILIIMYMILHYIRKPQYATYNAYLNSPHWRKTRQKILRRDHYQCAICGRKTHLQVHHKTYKHLGHERKSELITLCASCHRKVHGRNY